MEHQDESMTQTPQFNQLFLDSHNQKDIKFIKNQIS